MSEQTEVTGKQAGVWSGLRTIANYLLTGVLASATGIALTLVASLLICLGMHPESMCAAEIAAPILGLVCGGAWIGGRAKRPWLAGAVIGVLNAAVWFVAFLYLMGRWDTRWWISDALPNLGLAHLIWWFIAIGAGTLGSVIGKHVRRPALVWAAAPLILMVAMLISAIPRTHPTLQLGDGVTLQTRPPDREGTIVRLITVDLVRNSRLRIGLYDADSDDALPLDDVNTTYLGTPLDRTMGRLPANVLCALNAGFFGWTPRFVGFHVAPIVAGGKRLYNTPVKPEWWTFGIDRANQYRLIQGLTWKDLPGDYQTAITHVRPLIVDGKALELKPGAGVTRLRCSRCSIAWTKDSGHFYVLIVRDPDGEMAGVRQWKSGRRQTGGMDLVEIQQFWREKGVDNAIALDGGDSTQLMYRDGGGYPVVRSGYHLSRTLGYLNRRPIRLFVPMLPAYQAHNGVMNYLYVYQPGK